MTGSPDQPPVRHRWIATHGDRHERWWLAGRSDLDQEVVDILMEDEDVEVLGVLALNYGLDPGTLGRLVERHPELLPVVALNRMAPPDIKDAAQIGDHTMDSINRYLDDRGASSAERERLLEQYERSEHPGGPPLGEVWLRVRRAGRDGSP